MESKLLVVGRAIVWGRRKGNMRSILLWWDWSCQKPIWESHETGITILVGHSFMSSLIPFFNNYTQGRSSMPGYTGTEDTETKGTQLWELACWWGTGCPLGAVAEVSVLLQGLVHLQQGCSGMPESMEVWGPWSDPDYTFKLPEKLLK